MTYEEIIRILTIGASLCLGSYLTALRSKITSERVKNNLHFAFYAFAAIIFLASIMIAVIFHEKLFAPDWYAIIIILICSTSSILLFFFTKKHLKGKYQYKTEELDDIVNKFTSDADKKNIKLLAGDIDFFGKDPVEMDSHSQYICLRREAFQRIEVLCIKPNTRAAKIRYGKILTDFPQMQLKFYHPPLKADLNIRGRMKTIGSVTRLLIFNKIASRRYEPIETDTSNSNGALYDHIWNLIWDLAEPPTLAETNEYIQLFRE